MQKLLRKRLVGIGLVVALLAFAVPALAQNQWTVQTTPSPFATPVNALATSPAGTVDAVTYGGGITHGGTAGMAWYSTDNGANFTVRATPASDDFTSVLYDGNGYWYAGAWNTGLWQWDSGTTTFVNASAGIPWINQHVSALALDPSGGTPHTLYFATWGGGVYSYNFNTTPVPGDFAQIPNYPTVPAALFIHDIAVVPASCPTSPLTIYVATDGYGLLKGTLGCTSGVWTWTQVFTTDMYVYSVAYMGGDLVIGTKSSGIYYSGDDGATWTASTATPAITVPVTDLVLSSYPNNFFASTDGQGVYRFDSDHNGWSQINNGYGGDLGNLHVNGLAYDSANGWLYAGTGDTSIPGTTGDVYAIHLMAPVLTFASPFTYTVGDTAADTVGVTTPNQSPAYWTAMVTSGLLPPGLGISVDNTTGYPPVVTVGGTFTQDGCYTGTLSVYDAVWNRVDLPFDYTVNPGVDFTATPNPAQYGTVQMFQSTVTGATGTVTYAWDFGDTTTSTDANPTHLYGAPGTYPVTLVVTDTSPAGNGGCASVSNTVTYPVVVFQQLSISPTATQVGSGAQFQFDANALGGDTSCATPPADPYTYMWEVKDANTNAVIFTSTDKSPIYTFAYTGDFIAIVTVTDCSGISQTGSCSVNYNGPMSGTLSSLTNPAPVNFPVSFTGTAQSTSMGATYSAVFDFGDGTVTPPFPLLTPPPPAPPIASVTLGHTYLTPGTYTVKMTVQDGFAHVTVVTMKQVIYPEFTGLTSSITPDPASCQLTSDQPVSLSLQPIGGLPSYKYSIDWGDGQVTTMDYNDSAAHVFQHQYAVGGPYTLTAYVTDSGNVQVTQTYTHAPFSVVAPMTAAPLTANGLSCGNIQIVAPGGAANITLLSTPNAGSGTYNYDWNFGDGTAVVLGGPNPVIHTYGIPGGQNTATYTATVTVTDTGACAGQVVTANITFTLFRPLAITGTPTWQQACGSQVVSFDATGDIQGGIGPYTYIWNFDDGTSQTTTTPMVTHDFAGMGTGGYDVQLTVTDSATPNCGDPANTQNITWHIQVVDPIIVTATASPTSGCAPLFVAFDSTGTVGGGFPGTDLSYYWDFGDGGSSTSANPTHTFTTPGVYTVTFTATSNVVPGYACSTTMTITVYGGLTGVSFTQTETSGTLPIPITFTTTWTYAGAPGAPVTLTYNWGDGTPDTVVSNATMPDNTTHTFDLSGDHTVTVTATDSCGNSETFSRVIQILEPPVLTVTTQTLINGVLGTSGLSPLTVNFSSVPQGGVAPYTFLWNFDDGTTSTEQNPIHTYTTPGPYHVVLTVTDNYPVGGGGPHTVSASVDITVYQPMSVDASATTAATIISGGSVSFSANATGGAPGGYTYAWTFGDGGVGTGSTVSHTYLTAGTYYAHVHVTDSATNFVDSNDVVIRVYDPVTASASATPSTVIVGNPVTLNASASGGSGHYDFTWNFGDGTNGTGATINHTYASTGTFTATVTVTDQALSSNTTTATATVIVKPEPPVITAAVKVGNPFRIKLYGSNFQPSCVVTIGGVPVDYKYKNSGKLKLKHCKSLCPKGVPVPIVVTNPDGGVSNTFMFSR
jgi:PKD repeat protein